ncbi:small, acid-soluble spore protein K [Aquibacillus koreensis]|uniref:Small, acid-soluble spore protein K n=1 Tax=Aquibacillus koreensis TaxID=279446 RepID=A0A9X4AKS3_9BACI|nr:small, acid-soluble spore protein K [Aquibacillus koreensis]MCT2534381.1 small, acid-soluble spore protein K [Aquibacillus koreensis]MDC3421688.1 small, acid-soluble spore protein K [Aquibacillus koreensis]
MRNKKYGFPVDRPHMDGLPRAKAKFSPKRANGTINTRPQERMQKSSKQ